MGLTRKRIIPSSLDTETMSLFASSTVRSEDGCLNWIGDLSSNGYGRFRGLPAHRVALTSHLGQELPTDGLMDVDHTCRNRRCVEPSHLRIVTNRENVKAGASVAAPTMNSLETSGTCARGHDLTVEGAWRYRKGGDGRQCYQCLKDGVRRYAKANPEAAAKRDLSRKRAYQRGYNRGRYRATRQGLGKDLVSASAIRQAKIELSQHDADHG